MIPGKIRILHVLWSGHSGGAERLVKDIITFHDRAQFDHQVCFLSNGGWLGQTFSKQGMTVSCLGMKNGFSLIKGFRLKNLLNAYQPHIIHSHCRNFFSNFIISHTQRSLKIYFEHGGDLLSKKSKRDILFYYLFSRCYELILANSEYIRERILSLNKIDPEKVRTFYIGIDPCPYKSKKDQDRIKKLLDIDEHSKVIGIICRLVEQKGVDDFIETAHEIMKKDEDIVFLVVGEGEKRSELEKKASDAGVGIRFLGDRKDIPDILRIFDIFLFTSKWEPFGIVLLEAMAAQIPILGFAVGGAREIIEKGGGILLDRRDHKALARLAIRVLRDHELYNKLAAQGYSNLIDNFHVKESIKRLEQAYMQLIV